ncbi:roadblock/LC7 domain-containing protein [Streptomyces uncialis]|uniref:roadblock/LC7 domain-containing protein n=1 Tax=Streptomyces uncialis TaxID=1048205 RepID=UPI0038277463
MHRTPSETAVNTALTELTHLLDAFLNQVPGSRFAVLASRDGLARCSAGLGRDGADTVAALMSSLHSLGESSPDLFGVTPVQRVRQVVVEHDGYLLFVMAAAAGSLLAVCTGRETDAGVTGHEMQRLIARVGEHLGTPARTGDGRER